MMCAHSMRNRAGAPACPTPLIAGVAIADSTTYPRNLGNFPPLSLPVSLGM
jgi:hypothetical protein